MKRRIFATLLAFCLIASLCVVGAAAEGTEPAVITSGDELISAFTNGGSYVLAQDVAINQDFSITTSVAIDLNGNDIDLGNSTLIISGSLTISDSTADEDPIVGNEYNVHYTAGMLESNDTVAVIVDNGIFTLNSGRVESGYVGIQAGNRGQETIGTINIFGGYVTAQEFCALAIRGSNINVTGGVLEARDNAVLAGNGTTGEGGYTINMSGGTLIGNIITDEYASCGIYHPNAGTVRVSGGTIISTNGAGIVARAGQTYVTGGNIIALGDPDFTGKVGDSRVVVSTSGIVLDLAASYPGAEINNGKANNADVYVSGEVSVAGNKDALNVIDTESIKEDDNVNVDGGSFSSSVAAYVADGLEYEANSDGVYTYHRTIESAVEAAGSGGSVSMISNGAAVDDDTGHTITRIDGGSKTTMTVTDGYVYTLPELDKNGYTFVGWRLGNSNTILKPGDTYTVNSDVTFTAVWNMINVPDTYEISVISSDGGTVEASLSNASAGSVITLTVTPDEGYELAYITVDGERISGTSFVMPDHSVEVRAVFTEIGAEMSFVDVSRSDWFYDAVEYVYTNGLMEGTSTRTFEPNATMTRAMFWTVLARIDGETITGDNWKTLAQNWAVSSGISDGTNADVLITREQMVTMLYRFANSPEVAATGFGQFTDGASVSDWAVDAMAWALNNGVITGMGDGILSPAGSATRAQAAAMLMRFVEA